MPLINHPKLNQQNMLLVKRNKEHLQVVGKNDKYIKVTIYLAKQQLKEVK